MFKKLLSYFVIFCLIVSCYAHNVEKTCSAHKTRLFYDLLTNSWNADSLKKYNPSIDYYASLDYDDSNFTDQCPSLVLDTTPSPTDSVFLNESVINFGEEPSNKNTSTTKNDSTDQPPIATFEEWTKQKLEKEKRKINTVNVNNGAENGANDHVITQQESLVEKTNTAASVEPKEAVSKTSQLIDILPIGATKRNYASKECGSKVISANEEAENKGAILNDKEKDEYMRNPCEKAQTKFLVVELCETIQLTAIELANFELFSSSVKEFRVLVSQRYPTIEWINLGEFVAEDTRGVQAFKIPSHSIYAKFLRVELLSHYGKEHFCTLSALRAYGISMVDEYEAEATVAEILVEQQVQVPEMVAEQQVTQPIVDNISEPEILEEMVVPINEDVIEEPVIDGSLPAVLPVHQAWQFLDCNKCTRGQPRAISTWLCYVFSPNTHLHSRAVNKKSKTHRSAAQVKFLRNVLKPLPICLKNSAPATDTNHVKQKVERLLKTDELNFNNEIKVAQQTIVKSKVPLPTIPLPAGSTSHKESVFLKLNKRLAALELNISLSSEYLSELSRRYVAQIEESKRENERNIKLTEEAIVESSQKLKKHFNEQIREIKLELKTLTKIIKTSSTVLHPFWKTQKDEGMSHELSLRTCSKNGCDSEYVGVYLDENDGLWTTNQLLIILAVMQVSTIVIIISVMYFWQRHYSTRERIVLISSDVDLRNMIQDEIKKGIAAEMEAFKVQPPSPNLPNVAISDCSASKKKKKRKNQSLTVPESIPWDSTSCSSFSPADHDSASTTSTDVEKKGSVTSQDSFDADTLETNHDSIPCAIPAIA